MSEPSSAALRAAGVALGLAVLAAPAPRAHAAAPAAQEEDAFDAYVFGVGYQDLDALPEAIAHYTRAIELDPAFTKAYHGRGVARAQSGDLDGALADFSRAIELDPAFAKAYRNRGLVRLHQGQPAAAVEDLTRALALSDGDAELYVLRAGGRLAQSDVHGAIEDYTVALARQPGSPEVLRLLAQAEERRRRE